MKITQIANACCIYESDGYKILCDPWLTPGAFYGSWFHPYPLKTNACDLIDCDLIYFSHLHPDHFDPNSLHWFNKDKPILILDRPSNYLERMLRREGFKNIVKLRHEELRSFGPFSITMFAPFCGHPFVETEIGNPVDSAILVIDKDHTVLNANDNTLTLKWAEKFAIRMKLTVAQLNYNCAGPYPACFTNLSDDQRKIEAQSLLKRNLDHVVSLLEILKPRYFMPFAGEYLIAGPNYYMNRYLGTTTPEHAAGYVTMALPFQDTLVLREREVMDLSKEKYEYYKIFAYPYENTPPQNQDEISGYVIEALANLRKKQEALNCYPDCLVVVNGLDINLTKEGSVPQNVLIASLHETLFIQILLGIAHWNNAEIGCHILFHRTPNVYLPDVHMLMSYFHVPR